LRGVEAVALLGVPRTVDAVAIELAGSQVGKIRVPDEAVALAQRDAVGLARVARGSEQAEIDGGRVLREEGEVHPLPIPRGAERIRCAGPDPHGALVSEPTCSTKGWRRGASVCPLCAAVLTSAPRARRPPPLP